MTTETAVLADPNPSLADSTEIILIVDETSSMSPVRDVTISSFNEYLISQQNQSGQCKATLVTFSSQQHTSWYNPEIKNNSVREIFSSVDVKNIPLLTRENYNPNGWTNLYDAIGTSVLSAHNRIRDYDYKPNVLVVIFTDGEENNSKKFSLNDIKTMIKAREEQDGWTFVYMGANQDAWQVGSTMGLSLGQTFTYDVDNIDAAVSCLAASTTTYRSARVGATASTVERNFFASNGQADPSANTVNGKKHRVMHMSPLHSNVNRMDVV